MVRDQPARSDLEINVLLRFANKVLLSLLGLLASQCFAAGSFDWDRSGRDSIIFRYENTTALHAWRLDDSGQVDRDVSGPPEGGGFVDSTNCCVETMGDYNADGFADVLFDQLPLSQPVTRQYYAMWSLSNLAPLDAPYPNWGNPNDSFGYVTGRFLGTDHDSLFTAAYAWYLPPADNCSFNDLVFGTSSGFPVACPAANFLPVGAADLDGDGYSDIFFRDSATGRNWVWLIQAGIRVGERAWPDVDPSWRLVAIGDTSGSGFADLVWQHTSGFLWRDRVQNAQIVSGAPLAGLAPELSVISSGDYDGDGKRDLLVRRATDGVMVVLYLDATGIRNWVALPIPVQSGWTVVPAL